MRTLAEYSKTKCTDDFKQPFGFSVVRAIVVAEACSCLERTTRKEIAEIQHCYSRGQVLAAGKKATCENHPPSNDTDSFLQSIYPRQNTLIATELKEEFKLIFFHVFYTNLLLKQLQGACLYILYLTCSPAPIIKRTWILC